MWCGRPGRSGPSPFSFTHFCEVKVRKFGLYESGYANENGQGHCHGRGQLMHASPAMRVRHTVEVSINFGSQHNECRVDMQLPWVPWALNLPTMSDLPL